MKKFLLAVVVFAETFHAGFGYAADAPSVVVNLVTADTVVQTSGLFTKTYHYELQATNDAGAAQIAQQAVPFSASMEELEVVEAYTLKADGRKLVVNANSILTQAPQGAASVPQFDDQRQKVIIFPNVAGGDSVIFTMRLRATRPRIPGQYFYADIFSPTTAYKEVRETIVAPKNYPLYTESHDVTFEKEETGDNVTYRWRYSASNPPSDFELPPVSPLDKFPRLLVSSFKDYSELGRAYAAMAAPKEAITSKIQALADRLTSGIAGRRQQAEAIYNWVSKNVRYVAVDIGNGGIVPHDADSVLANAYGDCKDHAVLFAALLKARGIDSDTVLINSANAYNLPDVAALVPLNHAITWLPEFQIYADTTASTAPFGTLPFTEYGKPVVHTKTSTMAMALTPILGAGLATTNVKTVARIDKDGKVTGDSTITATGPFSTSLRAMGLLIQASGPERIAAAQLKAQNLTGTGNFETPSPLELGPDYTIKTRFAFGPEADWLTGAQIGMVRGIPVAELTGDFLMGGVFDGKLTAETPTACFSGHQVEELILSGPDDKKFDAPPSDVEIKTDNLQFTAHWSVNNNTITLRQEFVSSVQQPLCSGDLRKRTAAALTQIRDYYSKSLVSFVTPGSVASKANDFIDAGVEASRRGDLNEAIRSYSSALEVSGISAENQRIAHYNRGLAYSRNRDYVKAISDYSSAIELQKDDVDAISQRARAYAALGDRDKAVLDFSAAILLKPDDPGLYGGRGAAYVAQRKYLEATADFTTIIRLRPDDQLAFVGRANVYLQRNLITQAIEDCEAAIRLGRRVPDCFGLTGFAYYVTGKLDDAVSMFSQGIQYQDRDARLYLNRGVAYLAAGKYDDAIADFDKAVGLLPNNADAIYARGVAKQRRGDQAGGETDMTVAQKMNPTTAVGITGIGVIAGRYEYGKDDLQGCKAAESNHDIHQGLVFCYRAFLAPNLNSAEKATAREYLAMLYFGVKEFDEAVVHYDAALALNPRLASSLYGRGVAKLRDGNSAQGATDITAAKTIQANIETVMAGRGISP